MKIFGYSERGMINALIYGIYHSKNPSSHLNQFVSLISFPFLKTSFRLDSITTYIEQSFSDFGDADLLLLMENQGSKQCLFLEAKVKTGTKSSWSTQKELDRFTEKVSNFDRIDSSKHNKNDFLSPSNLFNQLYGKNMLVIGLKDYGLEYMQEIGLKFPQCDNKKGNRKLGKNETVVRAAKHLIQYLEGSYYVALVPDLKNFDQKELQQKLKQKTSQDTAFKAWQIEKIGFLTWSQVYTFCKEAKLYHTIEMFEFNKGQIY